MPFGQHQLTASGLEGRRKAGLASYALPDLVLQVLEPVGLPRQVGDQVFTDARRKTLAMSWSQTGQTVLSVKNCTVFFKTRDVGAQDGGLPLKDAAALYLPAVPIVGLLDLGLVDRVGLRKRRQPGLAAS